MRETEIKYCYKKGERPLITSFLKKNRYTQKYQVYEKDTYYTYKDRNFLKEDIALRVRKVQKESVPIQWKLTYKGPNMTSGGQDREELELQITENGDSLSKLLEKPRVYSFSGG